MSPFVITTIVFLVIFHYDIRPKLKEPKKKNAVVAILFLGTGFVLLVLESLGMEVQVIFNPLRNMLTTVLNS